MKGSFRKRGCKCPKDRKKCTCGATWSFRIDLGKDPITGERIQKEKGGFKSEKEAELAATLVYAELTKGTYVAEKETVFVDFAKEWISLYQKTGKVKPSTVQVRQVRINKMLKYFSKIKMKDITKKMYQDMLNDLKKNGYAHQTLISLHTTGKLIFKKAIESEIIKTSPTEYAVIPTSQKTVDEIEAEAEIPKYLEKEELAHFLKIAKELGLDKDYFVFLTLAYTGIRLGELCVLKWTDIDFEECKMSISKTLYNPTNNNQKYQLIPPKTKKSRRTIDIDPFVLAELEGYRSWQEMIKERPSANYHDKGFAFPKIVKNIGYPEVHKNLESRMTRLLRLAGLNVALTPHSLRHTHTSLLAEAGVSLEVIMDRLGHENDDITKRIYLHVTKPKKKEASQKFAELMRSIS
ncbi:MAG: ydcL [Bacilli bacterium]|nr:ydcL [Bacilli bacterium]